MRFGKLVTSMAAPALALALVASATACSDDETGPNGHTSPVAARLVVDGLEIDDGETLTLNAGETVEVEVRLLDEHGVVIDGIEESHYVKLNFEPTTGLATSVDVADHHFRKTVTAQSGTGSLSIGYGHDVEADEHSFSTFPVVITPPPCVCAKGGSPEVM